MKKNLKKLFAIIMTVAVVLSMAMPVMAEDVQGEASSDYTLTIEAGEKNADTTYNIYRIYSATVSEENSNIGAVYKLESGFEALKEDYGEDASKINDSNLEDVIKAAMAIVHQEKNFISATYSNIKAGKVNVLPGYYLIVPTGNATAGGTVTSPCLVAVPGKATVNSEGSDGVVTENVTVTPKTSDTSLEKKITGAEGANISSTGDSSVVAIGDTVKYTIKSLIPAYGDDADLSKVVYTITDEAATTLDYVNVESVTAGSESVNLMETTDVYTLTNTTNGFVMAFNYSNLIKKVSAGSTITIVVNFKLNDTAVVAAPNKNDVTLDYTNNVYTEEKSQLKDEVNTYTFGFGIQKVDSEVPGTPITGAEFEVRAGGKLAAKIVGSGEGKVTITVYNLDAEGEEVASTTVSDDTGSYVFKGLDEGTYTVTETKAPDGYKKLDKPITVEITATADPEYNSSYTVKAGENDANEEITFGALTAKGFQIKNSQGETLPGTGGIGTTIFTFGGLALIVLAGILLVVYTRKQKKA